MLKIQCSMFSVQFGSISFLPFSLSRPILIQPLPRLLDQIQQAGHFVGRLRVAETGKFFRGEDLPEVALHIKLLPPAVEDLEAGALIRLTGPAIVKSDGMAQPGTAPFQMIEVIETHSRGL
jgi:hypothetical protein